MRKVSIWRASSVLLALAIFLMSPSGVDAACVVPPPPCEAMRLATHVFLADADFAGSHLTSPQPVQFNVIEAFKGIAKGERAFEGRFEALNAEAISFFSQRRYFVYANLQADGILYTSCSRTRELPQDDDRFARDIAVELGTLRRCR